jgi:hypothetical protein
MSSTIVPWPSGAGGRQLSQVRATEFFASATPAGSGYTDGPHVHDKGPAGAKSGGGMVADPLDRGYWSSGTSVVEVGAGGGHCQGPEGASECLALSQLPQPQQPQAEQQEGIRQREEEQGARHIARDSGGGGGLGSSRCESGTAADALQEPGGCDLGALFAEDAGTTASVYDLLINAAFL